jgi:hypothetical protein
LAQEYHPDKNSSPEAKEKFTRINKYLSSYIAHTKFYQIHPKDSSTIKRDKQVRVMLQVTIILMGGALVRKTFSINSKDFKVGATQVDSRIF